MATEYTGNKDYYVAARAKNGIDIIETKVDSGYVGYFKGCLGTYMYIAFPPNLMGIGFNSDINEWQYITVDDLPAQPEPPEPGEPCD